MPEPLADDPVAVPVLSSELVFAGKVWDVRRDRFEYPGGQITREYVAHTGAVAVLALDEQDRVLLVKQYRHPIMARDWELPAGLLDIDGEHPLLAAQRELGEEADLVAADWHLLSEFFSSPGGSDEPIRVYLARGLTATAEAFERTEEEAELEKRWVGLDDAAAAVLERRVHNSILAIGVLAACASRAGGWASLGDASSPWPWHPKLRRK